jgi:hypothetical protein
MFAEAAAPFGRLVGFMFSPILRFAAGGGYSPEDARKRFSHEEGAAFERQRCDESRGVVKVKSEAGIDAEHLKFAHTARREIKKDICGKRRIKEKAEPFHRYSSYGFDCRCWATPRSQNSDFPFPFDIRNQ